METRLVPWLPLAVFSACETQTNGCGVGLTAIPGDFFSTFSYLAAHTSLFCLGYLAIDNLGVVGAQRSDCILASRNIRMHKEKIPYMARSSIISHMVHAKSC